MPALDLTWYQLEALNVVRCECGHRTNNHFDHYRGRPCAFCDCKKLRRRLALPPRRQPSQSGGDDGS